MSAADDTLICCSCPAACCCDQMAPRPAVNNMTMADDHADHDHEGHDHDHDEPKTAQNGAPMVQNGHGGGHSMNMTMAKALPVPDSCVKNPKQGNCSSFDYPHANAANDLSRLCAAMSFMAGRCLAVDLNRPAAAAAKRFTRSSSCGTCAHAPQTCTRAQGPLCIVLTTCTHKRPGLLPRHACE